MTGTQSVILRKLGGRRVGRAPIRGVEEIGENFAKILDERLRPLLRTIVGAIVIECEVRKLSRVLETIAVPAMIGVIKVEGSKNSALANLSGELVHHVVDLRLGGDPSEAPAATARSITAIDCALCADFVSAATSAFEASLRLNLGPGAAERMRLDHFEQHVTMVRIAPEHSDVLVLKLSLDIGEGARSGEFDLVLPLSVLDAYRAAQSVDRAESVTLEQNDLWSAHMARAACEAPVRMGAVLHREKLSLAILQELHPGALLPLGEDCRSAVELMVDGASRPFAVGRLGARNGAKAVKLTQPPPRETLERLRALVDVGEIRR